MAWRFKHRSTKLCFLLIASFASPIAGSALADVDVKLSGDVRVGSEYQQRFETTEPYYEGRAKFESDRVSGFKGEFEVRGESAEREVILFDTFLNYKINKTYKLQLGYDKMYMGREYFMSSKKRSTLRRTILYEKQEVLGFTGRQFQARLFFDNDEVIPTRWGFSMGGIDAEGPNVFFHYAHGKMRGEGHAVWLALQNDKQGDDGKWFPAITGSLWRNYKDHKLEAELSAGGDPIETEVDQLFGEGEDIYWYGAKIGWSKKYGKKSKGQWQPFSFLSYLINDHRAPQNNTSELSFGTNWYKKQFRASLHLDAIANQAEISDEISYNESEINLEVRMYF